jgi:TP901 family phage tail tape measure protein
MPMTIEELAVEFTSNVTDFVGSLSEAEGALGKVGLAGGLVGAAVATGLIVAGGAVTRMAADFQSGLTTLATGAGESEANLRMVGEGMLNIATATGTSTDQLIKGMFMIESAGYHGATGLNILKVAAEGAKVGNADLGTVADATTTILKDYPTVVGGATGAVNLLVTTVAHGKTHMEDLAGSLAHVLPAAAAAHIGLNDVMGAMATMTAEGVPAADAATYLRQTIISLEAPSSQGAAALKGIGLTTDQVAAAMRVSLPAALALIVDHLKHKFPEGSAGYMAAVKDIAGGSKQMQGFLDLTGIHMGEFVANTKQIGSSASKAGQDVIGWGLVQQDFNFKMEKSKAVLETLGIRIGSVLLPIVGNLVSWLTDRLPAAADATGKVFAALGTAASTVGGWFTSLGQRGGGLRDTFVGLAQGAQGVAGWLGEHLAPVVRLLTPAVQQAAATVGSFAAELATRLGPAANTVFNLIKLGLSVLQTVWNAAWPGMSAVLRGAWDVIKGVVMVAWAVVSGIIKIGLDILGGNWGRAWSDMRNMLNGIWAGIHTIVQGAFSALVGLIGAILSGLWGLWVQRWSQLRDFLGGVWNSIRGTAANSWQLITAVVTGAAQGLWHNITTTFSNAANWAGGVAANIRDGLANGIRGAWGAVQSALSGIVNSIIGFVTHALGIHSPSTVFAGIGRNAILGFVHGFSGHDLAGDLGGFISHALGGVGNVASGMLKKGLIAASQLGAGAWNTLKGWGVNVEGFLAQLFGGGGGGGGGGGNMPHVNMAGSVVSWLQQALRITGAPGGWLSALYSIAMHESGGNPNAINLWDSNAKAGHPSMGLMQTIMGTFLGNMAPGHGNIWNPVDNAAAAINYIRRTYGSVFNVPGIASMMRGGGYVGYAEGGLITEPIVGVGASGKQYRFGERGPEYIVPQARGGRSSSGGGAATATEPILVIIQLDGREIARQVVKRTPAIVRGATGQKQL